MRYIFVPAAKPVSPSLPAVVLVHGLMGYSFSWRHNFAAFSQHRDVYAIDLLGIGHSDRPTDGTADFSLPAAAARLVEFLQYLGHSQVDLVGTSHGGAVAMLAASQDRANEDPIIRRLVLVAPANPFMTNARLRLAFFRTRFGRFLLRSWGARAIAMRGKPLGRMYADGTRITPETIAGYAVNLRDPRSYEYALEVVRTWRSDMAKLELALHTIADVPALLLWGREDTVVSPDSGRLLLEFFRDAHCVTIPGAGHLPYEETPEEFNTIVLNFLNS